MREHEGDRRQDKEERKTKEGGEADRARECASEWRLNVSICCEINDRTPWTTTVPSMLMAFTWPRPV